MNSYLIKITGKVTGVGFRFYVKQVANALGITGWVKNTYNSSVECLAYANNLQITQFLNLLKKGNSYSIVKNVTSIKTNTNKIYEKFTIKY